MNKGMNDPMKRILILSAAVLCLLLSTVLFASCVTKTPDNTPDDGHEHVWDAGTVVKEGTCDPATKQETKGEKRYTCTVCGATKTEQTDGHAWNDGDEISAATCSKQGTKLFECTRCHDRRTEPTPTNDVHEVKPTEKVWLATPPTATEPGVLVKACSACGKAVVQEATVTLAAYNQQVNALKTEIGKFTTSDFGGTSVRANIGGSSYPATPAKPTRGQHPRVLINKSNVAAVAAAVREGRSEVARSLFLTAVSSPLTNSKTQLPTGKLPASSAHDNFNNELLRQIQALALDYQLTKNQVSGYGAVRAIMNYIKTLDFQKTDGDPERNFGFVMYTAACVYDWCYDLIEPSTRNLIVMGVQNVCCDNAAMDNEIGFPPTKRTTVAGHGCELQLLRDYLSFAIAIYDEYPDWWDMIAGRFYKEYVPARNELYEAGLYPQGVSLYIRLRFTSDLFSAWLIEAATGKFPYASKDDMKEVMRTVYSYELPNNNAFAAGDDHADDGHFIELGYPTLISSYLFNDATIRAQLESHKDSYTKFEGLWFTVEASVAEYMICSSNGVKAATNSREGMPLIRYNGGWLGQIIARNSWGSNQAAVLMKIGQKTTGNHEHRDAGQFQIFYKTMLAGDTGVYDSYGDAHWNQYHQATIAHNSILINGTGQTRQSTGANELNYNQFDSAYLKIGEVKAHAEGYADAAKTQPTYAYIAGDITAAYNDNKATTSSLASEVTRRMLTVFDTKNADVPLFFFVFDNIEAKSASYKKTFLLHVPAEPTISGSTVTVEKNGGKLVLQNLYGGNTITKIGGANQNYVVNGSQINPTNNSDDGFWGRVEVSTNTGSKTNQLLNVMYVTDSGKTPSNVTAQKIGESSSVYKGAVIGSVAAVFVIDKNPRAVPLTFEAPGSGNLTYYVSGVAAGNWTVSAGGTTQTVKATSDGQLLTFTAPAGSVTITKQ